MPTYYITSADFWYKKRLFRHSETAFFIMTNCNLINYFEMSFCSVYDRSLLNVLYVNVKIAE